MNKPCPFCTLPASRILGGDELAIIASDGFPVAPGHALIILRRHVGSFFETTAAERASLLQSSTGPRPSSTPNSIPTPATSASTTAAPQGRPSATCTST